MNKAELVTAVAEKAETSKKDTEKAVKAFTEVTSDGSVKSEKIQSVGLDIFKVSGRPTREGRNPKTGEAMTTTVSKAPKLRVDKALKNMVSEWFMRLGKFLKIPRLIKHKTVANETCDAGRVLANDKSAKILLNVKAGDIIEVQSETSSVKAEILDVQEIVKKDEAKELCRYL